LIKFDGKTAIVTGSSRGLGKSIARKLAELGCNVVLTATSDSIFDVENEFKDSGFNVIAKKGNVREENDIKEIVNASIEAYGKIDILVNNAGITRDKPMALMSVEDWDSVMDINLKGAFLFTKFVAKSMMKNRYGRIVNISSVAGRYGNKGQGNYSASKAGLIGLTKSTAKEFASRGITCNAVAPGIIISDMTDALPEEVRKKYLGNIALGRFGTPDDVANFVAFLASEQSGYVTGQIIDIDGGLVM
jgi:3-oxoacyl-[acyl-carrier protein] reductase